MKNPNHHKKECPEGWRAYNDEYRYKYESGKNTSLMYQSSVHYNYLNGVSYFRVIGETTEPIEDEYALKKVMLNRIRDIFDIKKNILIISQQKYKAKNAFCVIVQLHCILKEVPTQEQLKNIKRVCTTYNF